MNRVWTTNSISHELHRVLVQRKCDGILRILRAPAPLLRRVREHVIAAELDINLAEFAAHLRRHTKFSSCARLSHAPFGHCELLGREISS